MHLEGERMGPTTGEGGNAEERARPSKQHANARLGTHAGPGTRPEPRMHLAQLNVGRLRAPMDDPATDDFRTNLVPVNALADASPGFVWRLQDESGDATGIDLFDDELEIVNLSVWESIDALADYVYRSDHTAFLRRRREWFEVPTEPILCLWWVPEGQVPTTGQAVARLQHLRAHGPSPKAFTFRHRFTPDGHPDRPRRSSTAPER